MKNYKRIKKFGAAFTAVAMLGSLCVGAFADEIEVQDEAEIIGEFVVEDTAEEIIMPSFVEDMAEEILGVPVSESESFELLEAPATNLIAGSRLEIKDISLSKQAIAGKTDAYNYSVVLTYAFTQGAGGEAPSVAGKQVAIIGYTFSGDADTAAAGTVTNSDLIYAVDQADASAEGTFTIKMTSDTDAPKHVNNTDTLILKIGSDAYPTEGPQAVAIDLQAAVETTEFNAVYAEPSVATYDAPAADLDAIKAALATSITATVYDNADKSGRSAAGYATENWSVKSGENFTGEIGSSCVFVGDVVADEDLAGKFTAGALKVEVTVTVPALTDGTLTVTPKTVKAGDQYTAGVHELIDSIKIVSGSVEDTYAVNNSAVTYEWVGGTALDTTTAGNSAQLKVTVSGTSANGKFVLTNKEVIITITVTAAVAGVYGDVDGENGVDDMDWMYVLDWTSGGSGFAGLDDPTSRAYKAADVDGENGIDDMDWMYILEWTSGGFGHEKINTNF